MAQGAAAIDVIPAAESAEGGTLSDDVLETHPPLRLSPDKSEIITLGEDAGTVVLGNPAHLNILVDSARRIIAVPKAPGASYFTVLDKDGGVIMQRHVLVAPPKEKYVRVRKTCYGDSAKGGCVPTQTYYCPDICHEVAAESGIQQKGSPAGDSSAMKAAARKAAAQDDTEGLENEDTPATEDPVQE